jgi:hypothetical protein
MSDVEPDVEFGDDDPDDAVDAEDEKEGEDGK